MDTKLTAQEMFEEYLKTRLWWQNKYDVFEGTEPFRYESIAKNAYLTAHSAQQKVIDEYKEMLELQDEAIVAQLARIDEQAKVIEQRNGELSARWIEMQAQAKLSDERYKNLIDMCEKYRDLKVTVDEQVGEIERLKTLVDGAEDVVALFPALTPSQKKWKINWLKDAAKALAGKCE